MQPKRQPPRLTLHSSTSGGRSRETPTMAGRSRSHRAGSEGGPLLRVPGRTSLPYLCPQRMTDWEGAQLTSFLKPSTPSYHWSWNLEVEDGSQEAATGRR